MLLREEGTLHVVSCSVFTLALAICVVFYATPF